LLDERQPLVELGEHRLKDIPRPVAMFQLGDRRFPPLKTISNTNLPRPASSFIGRERELSELLARIEEPRRLVTLTGPGGSGKTRLALEAAATLVPEFKAGVFWVGLASLRDPALVAESITQTLGAKDGLSEHIGERQMLLLLDNLEQVIEAAPELSALLDQCPNLTILVTSRELLRVQGETEYSVPPLAETEAVSLFCDRAQTGASEEIGELCRRLDSLPLAVELAAARAKALSPRQILGRLSQRLDLLKGGRDADPRQQTLRATIEWSYDLLLQDEQQLFRRLSVFSGGCTLEAAEDVAGAELDTLQSLVEKSLLRLSNERYWMLETMREFALAKLEEGGDSIEMARRHGNFFLALAEAFAAGVLGPGQPAQVERLSAEEDNLRAALEWSRATGEIGLGQGLAASLWRYWYIRGALVEGRAWLEWALSAPSDGERRAHILDGSATFTARLGDVGRARLLSDEAIALWRASGERIGLARSLQTRQTAVLGQEDWVEVCEETLELARDVGDDWTLANTLINLSDFMLQQGDATRAYSLAAEALPTVRDLDRYSTTVATINLASAALELERHDEAKAALHEALIAAVQLGADELCTWALYGLAALAVAADGSWERVTALLGAADALRARTGATSSAYDERRREQTIRSATTALGPAAFAEMRERGRAMTPEEATACALSE
jgi:predicted ATPase